MLINKIIISLYIVGRHTIRYDYSTLKVKITHTNYNKTFDLQNLIFFLSFSSENYQVMNYGIGGHISIHGDSPGLPSLETDIGGWLHKVYF